MYTPTHVSVAVQKAKGLLRKGKNNTNDAFVTIALGKEKYQTSVKERATDVVEWHEECELMIPKQGNKAEIVLTVLHRNFVGDEFLGMINIPLADFDVYDKPKNKWYKLKSKPGHEKKNKERGDLEVRIGFTVQSKVNSTTSLNDVNKKDLRSSLGQLASSVGGSLLSLKGKDKKGLKSLAKSVGNKVSTLPGRGKKKNKEEAFGAIPEQNVVDGGFKTKQTKGDADPGVISDEEDEFRFDELSHKSSHSSLSISQMGVSGSKNSSLDNLSGGEFMRKDYPTPPPDKKTKGLGNWLNSSSSSLQNNSPKLKDKPNPIDDWEAKLFGKIESDKGSDTNLSSKRNSYNDDHVGDHGNKKWPIISPEIDVEEPMPKPRMASTPKREQADTVRVVEPKETEKEKSKIKESFASIFGSSKSTQNKDDSTNAKSAPIGITAPIRHEPQYETRLPKEVIRKFEDKSRDDLIEMVITLENMVNQQKNKLSDMEDYIDNLLVRVMEAKPTLLQSPFVIRPIK